MTHMLMNDDCIKMCSTCAMTCMDHAMNHCLRIGGEHVEPEHFKLLLSCAKVCETCAFLQLSDSEVSHRLCKACAEICEACAKSCEILEGMESCAETCRQCAQSCMQMAA